MNKLDKNGLVVNNIYKTDGTDVFEAIDSKMSLDEASENFLSLNGGTLSGNITFENTDIGNRSIGFKSEEGANAIFYSVSYSASDSNKGRFAIGSTNGKTVYWLTGSSEGNLSWNGSKVITNLGLGELENNLYFVDNSTNRGVGYKGYEGARIAFYSATNSNDSDKGRFSIAALKDANNAKYLIGKPDGTLTWNSSNIVTYSLLNRLDTGIVWTTDNSRTSGSLGFSSSNGARLVFYNKNHATWTGCFQLAADDGSTSISLVGKPDGTLAWNGQSLVTNSNKTHIYFDHTAATSRDVGFSTENNNTKRGAYITFKSGSDTSAAGHFIVTARDETNSTPLQGRPGGTLTWGGHTIYTAGNLTGGVSTIATSNLTASRALISNSSGKVAVSAITSTELGYLDGVTSAIQTQINNLAKYPKYTSSEWTYNVLKTNGASYTTTKNGYLWIETLTNESTSCIIGSLSFSFPGNTHILLPVAKGVVIKRETGSTTTGAVEYSMIYPT